MNENEITEDQPTPNETPTDEAEVISLPKEAFKQRIERAKNSGQTALVQALGYENVDGLKAGIDALQGEIVALKSELAGQGQMAVVRQIAQEAGARDAEDVLRMLDVSALRDEAGALDVKGVTQAIQTLRREKGYLFHASVGVPSNGDGADGGQKAGVSVPVRKSSTVRF
jgi:uncharacterized small protein (DUF1192 family)